MLKEALHYLSEKILDNGRNKARQVKVEGGLPGSITVILNDAQGNNIFQNLSVPLKGNVIKSLSLESYKTTLNLVGALNPEKTIHVYIGQSSLNAFSCDPVEAITASRQQMRSASEAAAVILPPPQTMNYLASQKVVMALDYTDAWKVVQAGLRADAKPMKLRIQELFTGVKSPGEIVTDAYLITDLITLLSKVTVNENKKKDQSSSGVNESLGLDVQRNLVLGDIPLPDVVTATVQMYQQVNVLVDVKMLFRYDFDEEEFVLTPIASSLQEATDATQSFILSQFEGMKLTVIPSGIELPSGVATLS